MCDPISMAVVAVVSTGAKIVGEIQSAKAQNKAIAAQQVQQQAEIGAAQVAEINDRTRQARKEQGRIKVAAGEAGLQLGGSVEGLLQDSLMQNSLANERTNQNTQSQRNASVAEANAAYSRVQAPSILGAGLRIATAGVSGFATGTKMQAAKTAAATGPN